MDPGKQQDGPPSQAAPDLTAEQLRALFDILTHHETYAEVESFKDPEAITRYGHPFTSQSDAPSRDQRSASPLLQLLLTRIILTVPGVRELPPEFWTVSFQGILQKLGQADLSESYDKGAMGTRKTLATAASAIHESVTRGMLGGVAGGQPRDLQKGSYALESAASLITAWDDSMHELVHGDLVDQLFDHVTKSDDFEAHSPAMRAAAEYAIIHLGSLLHYIFVLSAEGQYLLKLIENVHKLVPYTAIRQTLRIGNAATMLNAMIRLLLAKLGVGAISNWLGLTQNADDGMNLLQRIISMVLSWDSSDFRKYAENIESAKDGPSKEHLAAIKRHVEAPRDRHELVRQRSMKEQKSIVVTIFDLADPKLPSLTEVQHALCLEYYSANLAIRDRDEITKVLCRQNPDLFTSAIRMVVDVFDSMIRTLHSNVDLREHIAAMQTVLDDFIATSKPNRPSGVKTNDSSKPAPPSVEDFVNLLRRNKHLLYRYLHQLAKNCPEVREKFREWAKPAVQSFKSPETTTTVSSDGVITEGRSAIASNTTSTSVSGGAGAMNGTLQDIFKRLPEDTQHAVRTALDSHAQYLSSLERISMERMQNIIDTSPERFDETKEDSSRRKSGRTMSGPGVYLSRWQSLLDETPITPEVPEGPIRHGRDIKGRRPRGKTGAVGAKDSWDPGAIAKREEAGLPQPPDVAVVVDALGKAFREVVADLAARSEGR